MNGCQRIQVERRRQIERKHYSHAHDSFHRRGELAMAAGCYADQAGHLAQGGKVRKLPPRLWPFEAEVWKPVSCPVRNWEKAGALYLAECERIVVRPDLEAVARDRLATQYLDAAARCAEEIDRYRKRERVCLAACIFLVIVLGTLLVWLRGQEGVLW